MFFTQTLIMENDEITHPGAKDVKKREKFLSVQLWAILGVSSTRPLKFWELDD